MPIDLYPNIAKVKRGGVYQNLPGFVQQSGDADIKAMIANSETSTTAQYEHIKGSYFILDDVLYKAIVDIAINDTIAVGTNCEAVVLCNEFFTEIDNILGVNIIKTLEDTYVASTRTSRILNEDATTIRITTNDASGGYANIRTSVNSISLETGKKYKLSAKAKLISGTGFLCISLRKNTSGYPANFETNKVETSTPGTYDLETEFYENGESSCLMLFTTKSRGQSAVVEYSDIKLQEIAFDKGKYSNNYLMSKSAEFNSLAIKSSDTPVLAKRIFLDHLFSDSDGYTQGMCTDGQFLYYVVTHNGNYIKKLSLEQNEIVAVSENFESAKIGHGNSLTYNPDDGYIYCATMQNSAITVFDTSLNYIETITIEEGTAPWGISYNHIKHEFYVEIGNNFEVYDRNFNHLKTIYSSALTGYTGQGFETDGEYLYRLYSPDSIHNNIIEMIDEYGNRINTSILAINSEFEEIAYDVTNNTWYIMQHSGNFYKIFFVENSRKKEYAGYAEQISEYFTTD